MLYLIVKAAVSGIIVALASEGHPRHDLAVARHGRQRTNSSACPRNILSCAADLALLPRASPPPLRQGLAFWPAMVAACLVTVALYLLVVWLLPKLGVSP